RSEAYFVFPLAQGTPGKQCGLAATGVYQPSLRSPWLAAGERQLLRVEQGKGAKDRTVMVSAALLAQLRHYWQRYHPQDWLFPNSNTPRLPLTMSTAQKVFKKAKEATGIQKIGGIHSLRHAYATHQLQSGLPVYTLQQQLGHSDIHSTMHYVPNPQIESAKTEKALAV
uniref:tyrosine-type recombinase/integrase n=1 Tax=Thiolapillus sp. TaxID=2017437 RepID=UPI003AF64431